MKLWREEKIRHKKAELRIIEKFEENQYNWKQKINRKNQWNQNLVIWEDQ